jgi:hypothetical protein
MNAEFLPCAWRPCAVFITPCLTNYPEHLPVNTLFELKLKKKSNDKEHYSHQNLAIIDSKSDEEDTNLMSKEER